MNLVLLQNIVLLICAYIVKVSSVLSCETHDLQALMLRLRQIKIESEAKIKELTNRIEFLENRLEERKGQSMVAFHAYHVANITPSEQSIMVFSKVRLNQGGSYNQSTGIFIVPKSGTYRFYAHMCTRVYNEGYMIFDIMIGRIAYATAYGSLPVTSNALCDSAQAVAYLEINDIAFVRWSGNSSNICQSTACDNTFSGSLINN
ncbi:uncharacterized protein LOC128553094 [Mercenaria mercenaria]|uniref:uncharacterized protein LOC128553094 n=1 Tax=Mercenaria mercenaria TaxID=6596 RepID=UPI00234E6FEC|nr:uncharacterized protein LOC128553094 [Mercenaria mercenaria]